MKIKTTLGEKIFDTANVILLALACAMVIIPILHVIAGSLSDTQALIHGQVKLLPVGWNLENYKTVMNNDQFWRSFGVTLIIVSVGTLVNMLLTIVTAYPLSKNGLRWKKMIMLFIIFTMIFHAPIIPSYIVVKSLGLLNSVWAIIIPFALSAFNLLIAITFFRSLPEELFEAARVDGMNEYNIVFKIAVPLSLPIMVTLILFYSVSHWNSYAASLMYINDPELRPLQLYLYSIIAKANVNETLAGVAEASTQISPQGLQMATIIVATVPILLVYPFVQKHFIKGALVGSIKE